MDLPAPLKHRICFESGIRVPSCARANTFQRRLSDVRGQAETHGHGYTKFSSEARSLRRRTWWFSVPVPKIRPLILFRETALLT